MKTKSFAIIFFAALCLTLSSCKGKELINETRGFEDNKWLHFSPERFDFSVDNIDECYNINIAVTVDTSSFRYSSLPLIVNIYSPSGEQRNFRSTLNMRNKDGIWLGEWNDGLFTHTTCVRSFFFFNDKGDYKMEIGQGTDRYELGGVNSISLTIEQAELKYPK